MKYYICTTCGSVFEDNLIIRVVSTEKLEHFGYPCVRRVTDLYCPGCGDDNQMEEVNEIDHPELFDLDGKLKEIT